MYADDSYVNERGRDCVGFETEDFNNFVKDVFTMLDSIAECFEDIIESSDGDLPSYEDEDRAQFEDNLSHIYGKSELGLLRIEELKEMLEELRSED